MSRALTVTSGGDGGPAVAGTVVVLQGSNQPGEIELLVNADQQMAGVNEVPQPTGGVLGQGGISGGVGPTASASPAPSQLVYPQL